MLSVPSPEPPSSTRTTPVAESRLEPPAYQKGYSDSGLAQPRPLPTAFNRRQPHARACARSSRATADSASESDELHGCHHPTVRRFDFVWAVAFNRQQVDRIVWWWFTVTVTATAFRLAKTETALCTPWFGTCHKTSKRALFRRGGNRIWTHTTPTAIANSAAYTLTSTPFCHTTKWVGTLQSCLGRWENSSTDAVRRTSKTDKTSSTNF